MRAPCELEDFCRPAAPCALLKAAVLAFGVVGDGAARVGARRRGRAARRAGGGRLEIVTSSSRRPARASHVVDPRARLLGALGAAVGKRARGDDLVHLVLRVEQMMTTGGGWQDQVGGLLPGAKIARSAARLPLRVATELVSLPPGFARRLSSRLLLVFTGRQRLARNLLMDVLRRWAARLPEIVENVAALTANAEACARALAAGDADAVGACLSAYWAHKVRMAPGCEPDFVRAMMAALAPLSAGHALLRRGRRRLLVALLRDGVTVDEARPRSGAADALGASEVSSRAAEIDEEGARACRRRRRRSLAA